VYFIGFCVYFLSCGSAVGRLPCKRNAVTNGRYFLLGDAIIEDVVCNVVAQVPHWRYFCVIRVPAIAFFVHAREHSVELGHYLRRPVSGI
jgi:hypothetical protein